MILCYMCQKHPGERYDCPKNFYEAFSCVACWLFCQPFVCRACAFTREKVGANDVERGGLLKT